MKYSAKIRSLLKNGMHGVSTLFFPPHCAACGVRLEDHQDAAQHEEYFCQPCRQAIPLAPEHRCPICSHPLHGLMLCPNCEGRHWHLTVIVAGCRYEGLVREMIHRFKYGREQNLMRPLGDLMLPALNDSRLKGIKFDELVPVPLHPLREREREFNQANLLALQLGKHLQLPISSLLKRTRVTKSQAGFDRAHRLENLDGAFQISKTVAEGASLLLIDDVSTTGTTLDLCAAALLDAGAAEVCAVTVARG